MEVAAAAAAASVGGAAAQHFGLDLRSLAMMRILLGLELVADLAYRWAEIPDFYTDSGLMSRHELSELRMSPCVAPSCRPIPRSLCRHIPPRHRRNARLV